MGPGDAHDAPRIHPLAQGRRPLEDGDSPLPGRGEFGVAGRDRRGDDDRSRAFDVGRIVPLAEVHAEACEGLRRATAREVAARDGSPASEDQFGQRRHPRAAHAHEVDGTARREGPKGGRAGHVALSVLADVP